MSYVDEDEVVKKAIERYWRDAENEGLIPDQPAGDSYIENGVVVLVNVRGVLARYRHTVDAAGRDRFERMEAPAA